MQIGHELMVNHYHKASIKTAMLYRSRAHVLNTRALTTVSCTEIMVKLSMCHTRFACKVAVLALSRAVSCTKR